MAGTNNKEKLVIVGDGETAEIAYDYFTSSGNFEVVGFTAERNFRKNQTLSGLPVVPLEEIEAYFNPQNHRAFVAISYTQLNRLRRRLLDTVKVKGYKLCSYVSPKALIGSNVQIGDNCFIFEGANVQRGSKIADNVTIWSTSLIGHRSEIGENCFIASHVAISGYCKIGENSFLGVNCCLGSNVKIARDCVIGAGAVVVSNTLEGRVYVGNPAKPMLNKFSDVFISGKEII